MAHAHSVVVVDVVPTRPSGYATFELPAMPDGRWMVIRPLAWAGAHMDRFSAGVRPLAEIGGPTIGSAWASYQPVLRYDAKT